MGGSLGMKVNLGPSDVFFPVPAALIVTGVEPNPNVATVSWIGIVSSTPPTVGISLRKDRYTLQLIREFGEFTVNIPAAALFKEVDFCGLTHGRERDKLKAAGLATVVGKRTRTPIISECPYNMECKVSQEMELGDWSLILGEIVETSIDEDKMDLANRAKIDIAKVDPLVYCAEVRQYWSIGKQLGDGFRAGKDLLARATPGGSAPIPSDGER
jgi:flavin reductase (DIM6/NTAB) family NADH-FMN oxidoreductase RutF